MRWWRIQVWNMRIYPLNTTAIVAKALDDRYPLPLYEYLWVGGGERGSGPKGADDLCFFGKCDYKRYGFRGWDVDLEARILALSWSKGL